MSVLAYLLWTPGGTRAGADGVRPPSQESPVRLTAAAHIHIPPGCPLFKKLQTTTVKPARTAAAVLTVTGAVVASLRPAKGGGSSWQFNAPELLTTYTDWQRALADIGFARKQLDSIRQLADNRVRSQGALAARLKKLVEAGTDTERDLAAAQTELLQAQIQGRKDTHEAETSLRLAQRAEAALARQLQQAGVDPDLLRSTAAELDIVVADVPEGLMSRVKHGQGCEARFFGVPGRVFSGNVRAISPVLSRERRSLRVLYAIDDPDDRLRPGMFAEIGLGTEAREALLAPLAGVVHVGRADYLLVRDAAGDWRAAAVQVGELRPAGEEPTPTSQVKREADGERSETGDAVEILDGLRTGDEVMGQGAILLKPFIVEAVQRPNLRVGVGAS